MIVTDNFVFLHLHKSGGTFVLAFLQEFEPGAKMIGYHLPYAELPREFRGLPVLGTVRNPWSYYVSWYTFQSAMDKPNPLFRVVSDNGQLDFDQTISNLVRLGDSPQMLDALGQVLPDRFRPRGLNLTRSCIASLRDRKCGFYTFLFERMYGDCDNPRILPMENLRTELLAALPALGRNLSADEAHFIGDAPATNTTNHAHHREYYSHELRDLIARRDTDLIRRFGYVFA